MPALTDSQKDQAIELYQSGELNMREIAEKFGVGKTQVQKFFKKTGVKINFLGKDITGQKFNRLTVVSRSESDEQRKATWNCVCDCGNETVTTGISLRNGNTKSCGCAKGQGPRTHGKSYTIEYRMFKAARGRAKRGGFPFEIELSDVVIPNVCPVLGIKIGKDNRKLQENSPTLDKIIPELGYVKGNVQVISQRANFIKRDASIKELQLVLEYMKNVPDKPDLPDGYLESSKDRERLSHAKKRSKKKGMEFSLDVADAYAPPVCPVLSIAMYPGEGFVTNHSPSIDRIDNSLGYTPENTRVISFKANSVKKNASIEEVENIVDYVVSKSNG